MVTNLPPTVRRIWTHVGLRVSGVDGRIWEFSFFSHENEGENMTIFDGGVEIDLFPIGSLPSAATLLNREGHVPETDIFFRNTRIILNQFVEGTMLPVFIFRFRQATIFSSDFYFFSIFVFISVSALHNIIHL